MGRSELCGDRSLSAALLLHARMKALRSGAGLEALSRSYLKAAHTDFSSFRVQQLLRKKPYRLYGRACDDGGAILAVCLSADCDRSHQPFHR